MLRLTTHAGPVSGASIYNRQDWLDVGYEKLDIMADYRSVLFLQGTGAQPMRSLKNYPRWSASLWDLCARCIAKGMTQSDSEEMPETPQRSRNGAFIELASAVISHSDSAHSAAITELSTVEIRQVGRSRGVYRAKFIEDTLQDVLTPPFEFRPQYLRVSELVLHAALVRLAQDLFAMPPRPKLMAPTPVVIGGRKLIPVQHLKNPAKTGVLRWMAAQNLGLEEHPQYSQGLVLQDDYAKFLKTVV